MHMKKTIGYVRCSTEEQASSGHSLEVQKAKIEAYAHTFDLTIDEFVVDAGASAKSLNRPGIKRLMERVESNEISSVIIFKLDRISRAIVDLASLVETFNRHDTAFVSVSEKLDTGSASGRLMVNLLGVLSQFEREQISERTTTTLVHLREIGKAYGPTPYGYHRNGSDLVVNENEYASLEYITQERESGESYHAIAKQLNAAGVLTPRGGAKWYPSSVRSVLTSRMATA
jgi:site-specific DNA recombinase